MEFIQNEKKSQTQITNKQNWRSNHIFSDHKPELLLYATIKSLPFLYLVRIIPNRDFHLILAEF